MKCPFCSHNESKVVDSRPTDEGQAIRRRRECIACAKRFTTYEKIDEIPLIVVKKNGNRESYNKNKILNGVIKACEKRPVSSQDIEELGDGIEEQLYNTMAREITTEFIGSQGSEKIKELDEIAYVRFASVYREFKDINTFMDEVKKILGEKSK